jgi:NAD(P)-dependent dehydrogenase (short-subunit alcohol dehydrogenase family)
MKIAFVTGGAKRLGKTVVQRFAKEGYACLVHANSSESDARQLCESIIEDGGKASYFLHEIKDPEIASNKMLDQSIKIFGDLPTVSVLSAASYDLDPPGAKLSSLVSSQLTLNYLFPAAYCAALSSRVKELEESARVDRSAILFTDYKVAKVNGDMFGYSLSKHALEGSIPYLAVAFAKQIRVNAIAPGPILSSHGMDQLELDQRIRSTTVSGQLPLQEDIASTALFLSTTPSLYGQHIFVDAAARFDSNAREYGAHQ